MVVNVGAQKFKSEKFTIEVYDCVPAVTFPSLLLSYKYQIDSEISPLSVEAQSSSPDCKIESYDLIGSQLGSTIDPKKG